MRCDFCGSVRRESAEEGLCCRESTRSEPVVLSTERVAVYSVDEWFAACPPKGGEKQWKDGYSAKESAKAWFREGRLVLPREIGSLLASHVDFQSFRLGTVNPEVCTRLDEYRQGRNADAIVTGVAGKKRTLLAIEAKASETFGEQIEDRLQSAISGTNLPERINNLSLAVFGRLVLTVDAQLGTLRYQLLHALAATVIEATARGAEQAAFVIHHFPNARRTNEEAFADFAAFVRVLAGVAVPPGVLMRVSIPGSDTVSRNLPLYVGWADAPSMERR